VNWTFGRGLRAISWKNSPLRQSESADSDIFKDSTLPAVTRDDMEQLRTIFETTASAIESDNVEQALSTVSKNLRFLFGKNIPKLTEMMLQEHTSLRQSKSTMQAYYLIITTMDVMAREKKEMIGKSQELLRELLLAAKVSESHLKIFLENNLNKFSSLEFSLFLDAEIKNAPYQSQIEQLLLMIKLTILEMRGKELGVDIKALATLAATNNEEELKRKTLNHIAEYDRNARDLLVQSIRMNIQEIQKHPEPVDPVLIINLKEIERIVVESIDSHS
jgi:hypothetical protein